MTPEKALYLVITATIKALVKDEPAVRVRQTRKRGRPKSVQSPQMQFPDLGLDIPGDKTMEEFFAAPIPEKREVPKQDEDRPLLNSEFYRPSREVDDDGAVDHVPWMGQQ